MSFQKMLKLFIPFILIFSFSTAKAYEADSEFKRDEIQESRSERRENVKDRRQERRENVRDNRSERRDNVKDRREKRRDNKSD